MLASRPALVAYAGLCRCLSLCIFELTQCTIQANPGFGARDQTICIERQRLRFRFAIEARPAWRRTTNAVYIGLSGRTLPEPQLRSAAAERGLDLELVEGLTTKTLIRQLLARMTIMQTLKAL